MASNTMEIKVKLELADQDRALLADLLSHLKVEGTPFSAAEAVTPAPAAEPVETVNENVESVNENVDTSAEVKVYTYEEVQNKVKELSLKGKKDAIKDVILPKYDSSEKPKLSNIDPANYAAFMAELEALK